MRAEELWKAYWRAVHEEFFTKEFEEIKTEFNGQIRRSEEHTSELQSP